MDAARLRRDADIAAVWSAGMKIHHPLFAVRLLPNDLGAVRMAVSTPRSLGRAVARNRSRRRLREAFRAAARALDSSAGCDLVVVARAPASSAAYADIRAAAVSALATAARRPAPAP